MHTSRPRTSASPRQREPRSDGLRGRICASPWAEKWGFSAERIPRPPVLCHAVGRSRAAAVTPWSGRSATGFRSGAFQGRPGHEASADVVTRTSVPRPRN